MSVASPTVLPRSPVFPRLLPLPPHPHPIPPAPSMQRRERLINYRDLWREMEELSDEENAVEDLVRLMFSLMIADACVCVLRTDKTPWGAAELGDQEQRVQLPHPDWTDVDAARGEERCECPYMLVRCCFRAPELLKGE